MSKYILSPNAQQSLKEIKEYSNNKFGKKQTSLYLTNLANRMKKLALNPQIGLSRSEINEGYYSYYEGSHTIYYKILDNKIAILDVLHQSMEPKIHLINS